VASLKAVASALYYSTSMSGNCNFCSSFSVCSFADDITNSNAQENPQILEQQLLHGFNQTKTFCDEHQLVINASKSQLIVFQAQGKRLPADFALEVEGCKITQTQSVKQLRVTLD